MGYGSWDADRYVTETATRRSTGTPDFAYTKDVRSGKASTVHESLDPKLMTNGVRESRDSDEHPESLPVAVMFDVTGSMVKIPEDMQKELVKLMDVIIAKAHIADPHVLVGAIGDSISDKFPFQVGQFESDNRFDEQLRNIILEGGGGGQNMESYGLAFRFAAYHAVTDAWEKRGKKGYLITIGDENPWPVVTGAEVKSIFGANAEDETIESLIEKAQEKWELFHIHPLNANHGHYQVIHKRWKALLGERFMTLENEKLICETIASLVYMLETAKDVDTVVNDLALKGADADAVRNALIPISQNILPLHIAAGGLPAAHAGKASTVTKI